MTLSRVIKRCQLLAPVDAYLQFVICSFGFCKYASGPASCQCQDESKFSRTFSGFYHYFFSRTKYVNSGIEFPRKTPFCQFPGIL